MSAGELSRWQRRRTGYTHVRVTCATRDLLEQLRQMSRRALTLDDLVYELAGNELRALRPLGSQTVNRDRAGAPLPAREER